LTATIRNEVYRHRTTWYHNAIVNNKKFKLGDLVLKMLEAISNRERKGKLALKWDGPFKVIKVVKTNIYHLQDISRLTL
jgi:hypothetical protein